MIDSRKKINIKNETNGRISINIPYLKLKRSWDKKGEIKQIPFEELQEAYYESGVEYMFTQGMLSIEDMEVKKELGLEPDDAVKPVNIIILSDEQRKRFMTAMPMHDFREEVKKLPKEQLASLVQYAIDNEYANLDKCEFLKEKTGIDIYKAIQLNRADKEEVEEVKKEI